MTVSLQLITMLLAFCIAMGSLWFALEFYRQRQSYIAAIHCLIYLSPFVTYTWLAITDFAAVAFGAQLYAQPIRPLVARGLLAVTITGGVAYRLLRRYNGTGT